MKLLLSGSYNIAWFKLADFVARGEKERALSVYKLLMHSVADQAFALQLEGDILLSFQDFKAFERYQHAAILYKKHKKYQKAIAIYEHILSVQESLDIYKALLYMYEELHEYKKIVVIYARFAAWALHNNLQEDMLNQLHAYRLIYNQKIIAELYGSTVLAMLSYDKNYSDIDHYLDEALKLYVQYEVSQGVTLFMAKLKAIDDTVYNHALSILSVQ